MSAIFTLNNVRCQAFVTESPLAVIFFSIATQTCGVIVYIC